MSNLNRLCHVRNGSALAYKKNGSALIYKTSKGDWTQISFAWGSGGKDLDINGYWEDDPSYHVGYDTGGLSGEHTNGAYLTNWSGDVTVADGSEWVKIKMSPWSGTPRYKVHLNFFGHDAADYPDSQCTVIACQQGGETMILRNVPCSTVSGRMAGTSDPGVVVAFDEDGILQSLTTI